RLARAGTAPPPFPGALLSDSGFRGAASEILGPAGLPAQPEARRVGHPRPRRLAGGAAGRRLRGLRGLRAQAPGPLPGPPGTWAPLDRVSLIEPLSSYLTTIVVSSRRPPAATAIVCWPGVSGQSSGSSGRALPTTLPSTSHSSVRAEPGATAFNASVW